jgi:hypothetical protein
MRKASPMLLDKKSLIGILCALNVALATQCPGAQVDDEVLPPRGYVVVCQQSGQQTVQLLDFYENKITPFVPEPTISYPQIAEAALKRLSSYADRHAYVITEHLKEALGKARFIENIDLQPEPGEIVPSVFEPGCQVKKLYRYLGYNPNLPYLYAVDAVLWRALTESAKAGVVFNIAAAFAQFDLSQWNTHRWTKSETRLFTAMAFSSRLDQMSDRDWFSVLAKVGVNEVVFHGYAVHVRGAEFYEESGTLRSASPSSQISSDLSKPGTGYLWFLLKNRLTFYPSGAVHQFTVSDSYPSAVQKVGINGFPPFKQDPYVHLPNGYITDQCEAELYENHSLLQGCFLDAELYSDQAFLRLTGPASFYENGRPKVAHGVAVVKLSKRLVEVTSRELEMRFTENGAVIAGTIGSPTKIFADSGTFVLAPRAFTAYPNGNIESAYLDSDVDAKDCHGVMRHFTAQSLIHFNDLEEPCTQN